LSNATNELTKYKNKNACSHIVKIFSGIVDMSNGGCEVVLYGKWYFYEREVIQNCMYLIFTDHISMGGNAPQSVSGVAFEPTDLDLLHVCGSWP